MARPGYARALHLAGAMHVHSQRLTTGQPQPSFLHQWRKDEGGGSTHRAGRDKRHGRAGSRFGGWFDLWEAFRPTFDQIVETVEPVSQRCRLPGVEEIAVGSVARPGSERHACFAPSGVAQFELQARHGNGVARRADPTCAVGHVALVVGAVEVGPVPTIGKVEQRLKPRPGRADDKIRRA